MDIDVFRIESLMALIPALPLLSAILTAIFGRVYLGERSHWPTLAATVAGFCLSIVLLLKMVATVEDEHEHAPTAEPQTQRVAYDASGQAAAGDAELVAAGDPIGREWTRTLWTWAAVEKQLPTADAPLAASPTSKLPNWLPLKLDVTLRADPLTAIMLSMVLFIATLVAIYSSGYMAGDPGYWRFYTYVSLFVFSMTMLVSVSNFALLYVFWEAVGVCSYLLIGFWFQKPEAAAAGKKAFLVNRIGDFGFALAVFLIWNTYGTLDFHDSADMAGVLGQWRLSTQQYIGGGVGLAIGLLLLLGACGKSAQFPLHVWLPDAMEGPTPASALIHAATMVTAGVYLVARCTPLFLPMAAVEGIAFDQPMAHQVVAVIGAITATLAALIALTQTDLKRVLAYSTISQLGYMFLGLGAGTLAGIVAGMFHLFTHAFFKALLFMGAGSVMHSMGHVIDMRKFSGLRRVMPVTHLTMLFGCLALAGVVPFAGFWSKDAIVAAVHDRAHDNPLYEGLYYLALGTAFLTAFYTFRAFFLTFYGPKVIPAEAGSHAHESPRNMTWPLAILAACSLLVGVYYEQDHRFAHFLAATPSLAYAPVQATGAVSTFQFHPDVAAISTLVAVAGIGLAAFLYLGHRGEVRVLAALMSRLGLYRLSYGKFFFDPIYQAIIVWPLRRLAAVSYWVDRTLIDGTVNLVGRVPGWLGAALRPWQGGLVQFYALFMVTGLVVVLIGTLLAWQPRPVSSESPAPPAAESVDQASL